MILLCLKPVRLQYAESRYCSLSRLLDYIMKIGIPYLLIIRISSISKIEILALEKGGISECEHRGIPAAPNLSS